MISELRQVKLPTDLFELWQRVLGCVVDGIVVDRLLSSGMISRGRMRHFQHEYGLVTYQTGKKGGYFVLAPDVEVTEKGVEFCGVGSEFDYTTAKERERLRTDLTPGQIVAAVDVEAMLDAVYDLSVADKKLLEACIDSVNWHTSMLRVGIRRVNVSLSKEGIKYDAEDIRVLLRKIGLDYTPTHRELHLPRALKDAEF